MNMQKERIAKVCDGLKAAGLAGILVCPSEEMLFLTGFSPMMCERFQGLFITGEGKYFYICNMLYKGEFEHAFEGKMKIYTWMDGESMTDAVGAALSENGLSGKTLGVNSTAQAFNTLEIAQKCGVSFVGALGVLEEARIIKSAEEIQNLQTAAGIADDVFKLVLGYIRPGITEGDILAFLLEKMAAAGGEKCWGIVASGPNSSFPHYLGTGRTISEQDVMILDFGCAYKGMYSDMSRTVFVGGVTDEQKKIYEIIRRANQAGEDSAVNGAFIPDVDEAARSVIVKAGYGDDFFNRLGHGIGYMIHEAPEIKKNNRRKLVPGMAFSIEPGICLSNRFGMRIEDIVVVTESGNDVLNKASKELIVL